MKHWPVICAVACAQGLILLDGYNGPHGQVDMNQMKEEIQAAVQAEVESFKEMLTSSIRKSLEHSTGEVVSLRDKVDGNAAKALARVETAIETMTADGSLLRREVAEHADALEARVTKKWAQEQSARDESLAQVYSRIDALEIRLISMIDSRLEEVRSAVHRVDAKTNSTAVDLATSINDSRREALDAVNGARQVCAMNMSNLDNKLLHLEEHGAAFAERATEWSVGVELSLEDLSRNFTTTSLSTLARFDQTDETLATLTQTSAAFVNSALNWTRDYERNFTRILEGWISLEDAMFAQAAAVDQRLNETNNKVVRDEEQAADFKANALEWTADIELFLGGLAQNVTNVDNKISKIELELTANTAKIANQSAMRVLESLTQAAVDLEDRLDATVNATRSDILATIGTEIGNLRRTHNETAVAFQSGLETAFAEATNLSMDLAWRFDQFWNETAANFRSHADIVVLLEDRLAKNATNRHTQVEHAVSQVNQTLALALDRRAVECNASIQMVTTESALFALAADAWARDIEAKFTALSNATLSLESAVNATGEAVEAEVGARRWDAAEAHARINDAIQKTADTSAAIDARLDELAKQAESRYSLTERHIDSSVLNFSASLDEAMASLKGAMDVLNTSFETHAAEAILFTDRFNATESEIVRLTHDTLRWFDDIAGRLSSHDESLQALFGNLSNRTEKLEAQLSALSSSTTVAADKLDERISTTSLQATAMVATVETWTSELDTRCSQAVSNLSLDLASLRDRAFEIEASAANQTEGLSAALVSTRSEWSEASAALSSRISNEARWFASMLDNATTVLADESVSLQRRASAAETNISMVAAKVARNEVALADSTAQVAQVDAAVLKLAAEFEHRIDAREGTVRAEQRQLFEEATARLEDRFAVASAVLNASMVGFGSAVEALILGRRQGARNTSTPP